MPDLAFQKRAANLSLSLILPGFLLAFAAFLPEPMTSSARAAGTDLPTSTNSQSNSDPLGRSATLPSATARPTTSIVGIDNEQLSCFLGGVEGGNLLPAADIAARFRGTTTYDLYGLSGKIGDAVALKAPVDEGSDGECADLWRHEMALDPRTAGKFFTALRSTGSGASPLPAILEVMDKPQEGHIEIVRNFLAKRNVASPEVKIVQTIRTDLDGDGRIDWILNAVRDNPNKARKGDYSVILVLRGLESTTRTYIIQDEVTLEESPYPSTLWINNIVAVVDVDGDGAMEIILNGVYIYGGGWEVIRFENGGYEHVLFCGCEG